MYHGRLAPSPTGFLHLGHAATFLAAADRATAASGNLLLRIDDLDPQRSREPYVEAAREDLRWLGLTWTAELRQSNRLFRYREALQQLHAAGHIYPCTCTRRDLQQATQAPHEYASDEPLYNNRCRPTAPSTYILKPETNYRFRVPDGETITFPDGNLGPQHFTAGKDFGDFLVWRKDGLPSYQLATVTDDADMQITEIVRGRDLLRSTARQLLLIRALNLPPVSYFHTPLLLNEHGQRLAKRHDAISLRALRAAGETPTEIRARVQALLHHNR